MSFMSHETLDVTEMRRKYRLPEIEIQFLVCAIQKGGFQSYQDQTVSNQHKERENQPFQQERRSIDINLLFNLLLFVQQTSNFT